MPQIMSDGGVRHYFKIRGRDYPVELSAKDKLNKDDFQHIAATLYTALHERDILLTEVQPFREQYAPVAACLKQLLLKDIAVIQALTQQHFQDNASAVFASFVHSWRQHGIHEPLGKDILNELRHVILARRYAKLAQKLRSYGEHWQRLILMWILRTNLREKSSSHDLYLGMVERYLQGADASFYDAHWWDMPIYTYTRAQWETLGYEPCTSPTIRHTFDYTRSEVVYTHWQVSPIKGKAEVRRTFWVDQAMQTIPAIAAAFVSAYPPAAAPADYDALIFDMASVVSGEYGHEYYDLWDNPIPVAHGRNIIRMDFAQEVYRRCGWDFSTYSYYEFE